jgi:hypothetical protein
MKTGDILLFDYENCGVFGCFTKCLKCCTRSQYSHIGMILVDPVYIDPKLKGTYVWESTWNGTADPQDGKIKLGVQITPLEELIHEYAHNGHIYYRSVRCPENTFNPEILSQIHTKVYNKPYDIVPTDWIEAFLRVDTSPQKISRFWCSALVGYIYTMCGVIDKHTDWSMLRPSDFSLEMENLIFNKFCSLGNTQKRVF